VSRLNRSLSSVPPVPIRRSTGRTRTTSTQSRGPQSVDSRTRPCPASSSCSSSSCARQERAPKRSRAGGQNVSEARVSRLNRSLSSVPPVPIRRSRGPQSVDSRTRPCPASSSCSSSSCARQERRPFICAAGSDPKVDWEDSDDETDAVLVERNWMSCTTSVKSMWPLCK
jgi:hypothetical protein